MRHFKRPLIVTGIVLALALILGVGGVTWIHNSTGSRYEKAERAQMLGAGVALAVCVVVAPVWLFAAAKVGKERRAARDAARDVARRSAPAAPKRGR